MTDYVKREDVLLLIREESSAWKGKGDDVAGALNALECVADNVRSLPSAPVSEERPQDWPEDFPHENGRYMCTCVECGIGFFGHKRRVICKACAKPVSEERESVASKLETWGRPDDGWGPQESALIDRAVRLLRAPQQQATWNALFKRWEIPDPTNAALSIAAPPPAQQQTEPTDEQLEAMVEAYENYQSPADQGLAQQMEGMRLALKTRSQGAQGMTTTAPCPHVRTSGTTSYCELAERGSVAETLCGRCGHKQKTIVPWSHPPICKKCGKPMIVSPPDLIVKELLALAEERIVKLEQEAERWNQPSRVIDTLVRFLLDTQIADPKWAAPMTRAIYTALNNAWPKP